jgi:hypothetical protein
MLEGLHSAASTVRTFAPALLVGPHGETIDMLADASSKLETALQAPGR